MQLFNKEQREGFAKIADNLVTASIVATILGGFVDKKIGAFEVTVLISIAVTFLVMSYVFRRSEDNGN
jgi:undecaprenyl pyrophosphate phosphatase UppP